MNTFATPPPYVTPDGRLDMDRLLRGFAEFWREYGDVLLAGEAEAARLKAPFQLVLLTWLHRLTGHGGFVDRDHAVGLDTADLLIRWPYVEAGGRHVFQREVIEVGVWRTGADPLPGGLRRLDHHLSRLGLDHGTVVIFDERPGARSPDPREAVDTTTTPAGHTATTLRA